MSTDPIAKLASAAAHTDCPFCSHEGLEFALRCDLGGGPCLFTARCDRCRTSFEIVVSESELAPSELAETVGPCERCGAARRIATLTCSERTRACVYHVECRSCGRVA